MKRVFEELPFAPADILLPKQGIDLTKWAVVACDQFTSQMEYWQAVEQNVGDAPSTLRLILPEAQLGAADLEERIAEVDRTMERYLAQGVFTTEENALIYVRRTQSDGTVRQGLIGRVDLEQYDFTPGSGALIRATEGTVLSRIPPRMRVRSGAAIELPHVMLLIDDPDRTVIEPLDASVEHMRRLYDFTLQQGGGSLSGWKLTDEQQSGVAAALRALCAPEETARKYGLHDVKPLLFAVGDGNHSLASAKACYEAQKAVTPPERWAELPSRWALVEVVNNHDDALRFEPIHRLVTGVEPGHVLAALLAAYPGAYEGEGEGHTISYTCAERSGAVTIPQPQLQLAVGTLQAFLDAYLASNPGEVDYIHGDATAETLGRERGCISFCLPAMAKEQLFKTVMADGVLPRKTFSMGHAEDKRYYMEARKIR